MATAATKKTLQLLGPAWTRAFRCVWMLEELQGDVPPYAVVENSMPMSNAVRKYVSTGKVPVLLEYDGGGDPSDAEQHPSFVLSESSAINTYLADHYGGVEKGLIPPAYTRQRAKYDETVSCIVTELDAQALWIHRKHEAMSLHFGAIPEAVAHAEQQFERINLHLSAQLNPYLLGEHFTAADILYVHCLDWSKGIGWHKNWPTAVEPYRQLCHARPAYRRAVALRDTNKQDRTARVSSSGGSSSGGDDSKAMSKL